MREGLTRLSAKAPVLPSDGNRYPGPGRRGQRPGRRNTTMASKQADELRTLYRSWAAALSEAVIGDHPNITVGP